MPSRTILVFILCSSSSLWAQQQNQKDAGGHAGPVVGFSWLAEHQNLQNGGFQNATGKEAVAPTGLATLAYLGAGYTDRGSKRENKYARNVRQALRFLMTRQDEHGKFGTGTLADHALATLAMTEAYGMTRNPRYRKPAMEGLKHIEQARRKGGVWGDIDTTGFCIMALKSGKFGGLAVDENAFSAARRWLDRVTDPKSGRVSVGNESGRATAIGMLIRIFCGEKPQESPAIEAGAKYCLENPPDSKQAGADQAYWWIGTLATFQVGGTTWKRWNQSLKQAIKNNRDQGDWKTGGEWGRRYGTVGSAAAWMMCAEVYYRYDRYLCGLGK